MIYFDCAQRAALYDADDVDYADAGRRCPSFTMLDARTLIFPDAYARAFIFTLRYVSSPFDFIIYDAQHDFPDVLMFRRVRVLVRPAFLRRFKEVKMPGGVGKSSMPCRKYCLVNAALPRAQSAPGATWRRFFFRRC